ncbi:hypothetical protein MO867_12905 [Microbulbifer sp. OS29]|uniref:Uncharacterized protein n=1 Tax=Microbulbifer okhotskensis TaxID=2926617 RepID=A0A9X2J554_9GAMM|nr:hypothetical protein [Microbulbifer okhotskensis]MCO1335232.1 hypothetical protein [Microbulbifer okhotskensis]
MQALKTLEGLSLEWTGTHYSKNGDFPDLSTHTVVYETASNCYVIAAGKLVGEASYTYEAMDERMAALTYRPQIYQGRKNVLLYAMLDFVQMMDRAIILYEDRPLALANGSFQLVNTPVRPKL